MTCGTTTCRCQPTQSLETDQKWQKSVNFAASTLLLDGMAPGEPLRLKLKWIVKVCGANVWLPMALARRIAATELDASCCVGDESIRREWSRQ
jgi:hypothetical protein